MEMFSSDPDINKIILIFFYSLLLNYLNIHHVNTLYLFAKKIAK